MESYETCRRCTFFKSKQGVGKEGECHWMPPVLQPHGGARHVPVHETGFCGQFKVNLQKYHVDGKKIYTRVDTKMIRRVDHANAAAGYVPLEGEMFND